jgi:hypothetical protein
MPDPLSLEARKEIIPRERSFLCAERCTGLPIAPQRARESCSKTARQAGKHTVGFSRSSVEFELARDHQRQINQKQ